jgi:phosphoglycerol transferase MdoB-like AlkP superfamily enzyme
MKFDGLSTILKSHNYTNLFFTTHDGQFDNYAGFLYNNNFHKIYDIKDYPTSEVVSDMGVPDDFMFRFSIPIYNELFQKNTPFFSVMFTGSDHLPYNIPSYFKPKNSHIKEQIVEYADWSLRQFMEEAKKQD